MGDSSNQNKVESQVDLYGEAELPAENVTDPIMVKLIYQQKIYMVILSLIMVVQEFELSLKKEDCSD